MFEGFGKFLLVSILDFRFYVDDKISLSKFLSVVLDLTFAAKSKKLFDITRSFASPSNEGDAFLLTER